jgi:hypothetical protein
MDGAHSHIECFMLLFRKRLVRDAETAANPEVLELCCSLWPQMLPREQPSLIYA